MVQTSIHHVQVALEFALQRPRQHAPMKVEQIQLAWSKSPLFLLHSDKAHAVFEDHFRCDQLDSFQAYDLHDVLIYEDKAVMIRQRFVGKVEDTSTSVP